LTSGGPPSSWLGEGLTTPHRKKLPNVTEDLGLGLNNITNDGK